LACYLLAKALYLVIHTTLEKYKLYLNSFNHFRAIAIILIVAGHSAFNIKVDSIFENILMNLVLGATALFVFISGFLFHHIFYKKFNYVNFISGKFINLIIPYTLLSIIPIVFLIYRSSDRWGGYFLPSGDGTFREIILPAIKYYFTGRFLTAYWYIPFIFLTFTISPLHMYFIQLKKHIQLILIVTLSLVSIYIHRPIDNINAFQSVIYYTPIYLLGIFCSMNKEEIYLKLKNKEYLLFIIMVFFATVEYYFGYSGNYEKSIIPNGVVDLMFIQKVFMCLFFMVFLARFEHVKNSLVQTLASTSFAIFFLHPIFMKATKFSLNKLLGLQISVDSWTIYFIYTFLVILICVLFTKLIKFLIPNKSRYIIGY